MAWPRLWQMGAGVGGSLLRLRVQSAPLAVSLSEGRRAAESARRAQARKARKKPSYARRSAKAGACPARPRCAARLSWYSGPSRQGAQSRKRKKRRSAAGARPARAQWSQRRARGQEKGPRCVGPFSAQPAAAQRKGGAFFALGLSASRRRLKLNVWGDAAWPS